MYSTEQCLHWSDNRQSHFLVRFSCFTPLQVDVVLDANNLPIKYTCPDNSKFVEVGAAAAAAVGQWQLQRCSVQVAAHYLP
jgi:hypothetical protein